jgi:hypothetical protein
MDILISPPMGSAIDRFEDWTAGVVAGASRVVRRSGLTNLDIEIEAPVRLARRGSDRSGTPGRRRRET